MNSSNPSAWYIFQFVSSFSAINVLYFPEFESFTSLVRFIPRYFITFDATANRIAFLISLVVHYSCIEIQEISVILILYPAT